MIRIYGASDDLIEVEGDISEEFQYAYDAEGDLIATSDGWVFRIYYDRDGVWRIVPLIKGKSRLTHIVAPIDDNDCYSDAVHLFDEELDEPIAWVVHGFGEGLARRRR
jgi:hypothetical protein